MMVSIMTNQMMLTTRSHMLDSQLSTEVKYMARYELSFFPRFCFANRTNIYYIPNETGLHIFHYKC